MARDEIKCPAAQERHPATSPNAMDVECRLMGNLRPARSSPDAMGGTRPVVCCDAYAECQVWKHSVEIERFGPSQKAQRNHLLAPRSRDTLAL